MKTEHTASGPAPVGRGATVRAAAVRTATLAGVWWVVSEGSTYGIALGVVVVLLATTVSLRLRPPVDGDPSARQLAARSRALLGLVPWLVLRSLVGGIDVARRALAQPLRIEPGMITHQLAIPPGQARTIVLGLVSLTPGTLAARIEGDVLHVHALDVTTDVAGQVSELEDRVGRVSGWTRA